MTDEQLVGEMLLVEQQLDRLLEQPASEQTVAEWRIYAAAWRLFVQLWKAELPVGDQ